MKRVAIYLPDDILVGLRKMAAGENRSVAGLIRGAVDRVYGEDIEDVRVGEAELEYARAHPESLTSLEDIIAQDEVLRSRVAAPVPR